MSEAIVRIQKLAEVLANEDSDSDDLIHAFGDIEELRYDVADALLKMMHDQQGEAPGG